MTKKTEDRYLYELKKFIDSGKCLEEYIKENIKDKKQLSKLKNGLKLTDLDFNKRYDSKELIKREFENKKKYKRENKEIFKLKNAQNAINRIKNKRLKLAYRLMIISGLRISEIAKLTENDISVDSNNNIIINVKHGKGDKNRTVTCLHDDWVLNGLLELDSRKDKLFYSDNYLKRKAWEYKFQTHDLRRTFAEIIYYADGKEQLQEKLGHNKNSRTYLKYLNRVNLYGTRHDI